jgi:hypothetical protein
MPTTVDLREREGMDLIIWRWRAGTLYTSGIAIFDRGISAVSPYASGWELIRLRSSSEHAATSILSLEMPSASSSYQGSIKASGMRMLIGTCTNLKWWEGPPTCSAKSFTFYKLRCILASLFFTLRLE